MEARERIYVALDTTDLGRAQTLVKGLAGRVGGFKIGKEFLAFHGSEGARAAVGGEPLFLDVKYHDIPNTVASALRALLHQRPRIVNVHAAGGPAMLRASVEAVQEQSEELEMERPWLIAVTVLTSLDDQDLEAVGQSGPVAEQVKRLAGLSQACGLDGVVCSPKEIALLREECGPDFKLVVPGIRPEWAASGDQKRIMTPRQALEAGADVLVIGRPITAADDPLVAAQRIEEELAGL